MPLLPLVRGLHIGATLLLAGASAFEIFIVRGLGEASDQPVAQCVRRWLRLLRVTGLIVGVLSWFAWLALLAISMSGLSATEALGGAAVRTVVTRTTFGHVWLIRAGLFVVLAAALGWHQREPRRASKVGITANAVGSIGLVCSFAWTGHAVGANPAHLVADVVHLLAAAVWYGMIPPLWLIVRRATATATADWRHVAVAAADHFFWPGLISVIALAASGLASATWLVGSVRELATTPYGRLLAIKVSLFVFMLAAATVNRSLTRKLRVLGSADEQHASLTVLRTSISVEFLLGVAVIAVVALLGVTPPPAHQHSMHHMSNM
jgi:copper resistance protein D